MMRKLCLIITLLSPLTHAQAQSPQATAPAQQPPQARGKEGRQSQDAGERDDRKKAPHERPEDREKRNGERER